MVRRLARGLLAIVAGVALSLPLAACDKKAPDQTEQKGDQVSYKCGSCGKTQSAPASASAPSC